MSPNPPFVERLRQELLDGAGRYERQRRRRLRAAGTVGAIAVLIAAIGLAIREPSGMIRAGDDPTSTTTTPTTGETVGSTTSTTRSEEANGCRAGATPQNRDSSGLDALVGYYNRHDANRMVAFIGDGIVIDPSLEPGRTEPYPSVAAWLEAAAEVEDRFEIEGYGAGAPLGLFVRRTNLRLTEVGIDSLSITMSIWPGDSCEARIEVRDVISSPDPCAFEVLIGGEEDCAGPFEPRMVHHAVWTGSELLIHGGQSGTHTDPLLRSGLAFDPATGAWRDLAPSPVFVGGWPPNDAYWTGKRMIVAGMTPDPAADGADSDGQAIRVLSYYPDDDRWSVSEPLPEERLIGPGATAFSGSELFLFGGSNNDPLDTAWSFDLETDTWRQLPDPGIPAVEESAGVWTGTEAVFHGGYTVGGTDNIHVAFDPETRQWRELPDDGGHWIQSHRLIWTGSEIVVTGGHAGPSHDAGLRIFDPATETWRRSAPIPVPATEDPAAAWTGDRLLLWGGHATYGGLDDDGDHVMGTGAIYEPDTDSWTILNGSSLDDRCHHSGTWIDDAYVVFGGITDCGNPGVLATGTGAVHRPDTGEWEPLTRSGD